MVPETSVLVALIQLIDRLPEPPRPAKRRPRRPDTYSDRLLLKALVIRIVKHLAQVHTLLAVLDQPTPEMRRRRALLTENGRYPTRRTWERRLKRLLQVLLGHSAIGVTMDTYSHTLRGTHDEAADEMERLRGAGSTGLVGKALGPKKGTVAETNRPLIHAIE